MTPLFWQSNYVLVQNNAAFFAGVSQTGDYFESQDHSSFRTWIVVEESSSGLKSPCRATFGGFFTIDKGTFASDLRAIVSGIKLRHPGQLFRIYLSPEHADLFAASEQKDLLAACGFSTEFVDLDYYIEVKTWDESRLSKGNRKKLRQWREAGGQVTRADVSEIKDIYEVIRVNRESLGVEPSITLEKLENLVEQFPDNYELYIGRIGLEIAAVAVTVNTHVNTKYVFFWADVQEYRILSPVVAMCAHLVRISELAGISVLDLGISTEDGVRNEGLIRFKSNLGAEPSMKYMLRLQI